ncbi:MAG: EAL domain-containing protein [Coprococcus sp.]
MEKNLDFALSVIYDNYIKLALMNIDSGEYVIIKGADTTENVIIPDGIDNFLHKVAENSGLHPDDIRDFYHFISRDYIKNNILNSNRCISQNFRYKYKDDIYRWVTFEIIIPKEYSEENPWVIMGVRYTDSHTCILEEGIKALSESFYKILKVNLTNDTYEQIIINKNDFLNEDNSPVKVSEFFDSFGEIGCVYSDDVEKYKQEINIDYLRNYFSEGNTHYILKYRRLVGAAYRWVAMEMIAGNEYQPDNQVVFLYVRDVQDEYLANLSRQKQMEYYCYKDALTDIGNRNLYNELCDRYMKSANKRSVGVVFSDVNKLKYVNDKFGHKEGDRYLKRIADMLIRHFGQNSCYRISGDEFVVVFEDIEEQRFNSLVDKFRETISQEEEAPCAVGCVWEYQPESIELLVNIAEKKMYNDKMTFYSKHPEVKRRSYIENENGEETCSIINDNNELMKIRNIGRTDRIFDALAATTKRNYIYMTDIATDITKWSISAVEYFGLPGQYIYQTKDVWGSLIHPDDREAYFADIDAVFAGKKKQHALEYRIKNKKGEYVVCTCRGIITKKENGDPEYFVGTIVNHGIVDCVDPVTNLHNNNEFNKIIKLNMESRLAFSVLGIGIDMFNNINMLYGYAYGNEVLKKFAIELKNIIGGRGMLYRLDGAKFAVCFNDLEDKEDITELYAQIRDAAVNRINLESERVPLKIYGGAVIVERLGGDDAIRGCMAYALERSRYDKHGELVFFNDEVNQGDKENLELFGAIHRSVLKGSEEFYLCYQPIGNSDTGKIIGMEALLRWKKNPYGVVSPGRFIPWLENEPCFIDLGNWIIERALLDAKDIVEKRPDFILNVNISASQFEHPGFRKAVADALQKTGFPPKNFCMELTERCKNLDFDYLINELKFFKSMGIKIALDDFGTGDATLNLLTELPIDELKVDMSFVRGIQHSKVNQVLVKTVVQCAHGLGLKSCIEGVENRELFDYLKDFGATYCQGYYFSVPVPIEEFKKLI